MMEKIISFLLVPASNGDINDGSNDASIRHNFYR